MKFLIVKTLEQFDRNVDITKLILCTDETTFTGNGINDFRNTYVWALENPHVVKTTNFPHTFSLNVWVGLIKGMLI